VTLHVNDGGTWKSATPWVNDGGTWKPVQEVWVNNGGTWVRAYSAVTFTPPAGSYEAEGYYQVQYTLACSLATTWTFSLPSGVTASVANGGSATAVSFTLTSGSASKPLARTVQFAVTGTANGVTANFTITLIALSDF